MTDLDMNGTGGVSLTTATHLANQIESGAMDVKSPQAGSIITDATAASRLPVTVERPIPYTFDLGNLTSFDPNPLSNDPNEAELRSNARDAAQALINQLLTTCQVKSTSDGVHLLLPAPTTPLPREKPIPKEKEPTKWELFAKKKGIKDKKREGKMVYDEERGDWVPKWGYKGKNKDGDNEWLVEVDEKKERETGEAGDSRTENRKERKERVRRNERKQRANDRNGRKNG